MAAERGIKRDQETFMHMVCEGSESKDVKALVQDFLGAPIQETQANQESIHEIYTCIHWAEERIKNGKQVLEETKRRRKELDERIDSMIENNQIMDGIENGKQSCEEKIGSTVSKIDQIARKMKECTLKEKTGKELAECLNGDYQALLEKIETLKQELSTFDEESKKGDLHEQLQRAKTEKMKADAKFSEQAILVNVLLKVCEFAKNVVSNIENENRQAMKGVADKVAVLEMFPRRFGKLAKSMVNVAAQRTNTKNEKKSKQVLVRECLLNLKKFKQIAKHVMELWNRMKDTDPYIVPDEYKNNVSNIKQGFVLFCVLSVCIIAGPYMLEPVLRRWQYGLSGAPMIHFESFKDIDDFIARMHNVERVRDDRATLEHIWNWIKKYIGQRVRVRVHSVRQRNKAKVFANCHDLGSRLQVRVEVLLHLDRVQKGEVERYQHWMSCEHDREIRKWRRAPVLKEGSCYQGVVKGELWYGRNKNICVVLDNVTHTNGRSVDLYWACTAPGCHRASWH